MGKMKKGQMLSNPLILICRGDLTRTDDPHALRDTLADRNFIVFQKSGSSSFFYEPFKFHGIRPGIMFFGIEEFPWNTIGHK